MPHTFASEPFGDLLNRIFRLYWIALSKCWPIALLAAGAVGLALRTSSAQSWLRSLSDASIVDVASLMNGKSPTAVAALVAALLANSAFWWAFAALNVVLTILFCALLVQLVDAREIRLQNFVSALFVALLRGPKILLATAIYIAITSLGMFLLIVPGINWTVSLMFSAPAIVEGSGVIDSFRLSHNLVKGVWWRTSAITGVAAAVSLALFIVANSFAGQLAVSIGGDTAMSVPIALSIATFAILPLQASFLAGTYRELKQRGD